jgi:hypothetical protein
VVREVVSPDGVTWRVEIDWVARRLHNPFRRSAEIVRARVAARRERREQRKRRSDRAWYDAVDCPAGDIGSLDDLLAIVLVIVAVVLIVFAVMWLAPVIWAIVLVLFEFFFVTIAAVVLLVWRTAMRRPWRVVARGNDEEWAVKVVGHRAAQRRVNRVADRLANGAAPKDVGLRLSPGNTPRP